MIGIIFNMEKYYPEEMLWIFPTFSKSKYIKIITSVLDLLIVWYVLYLLITVFKGTKAIQLLKGIVVIVIGQQVSKMLNLTATQIVRYRYSMGSTRINSYFPT